MEKKKIYKFAVSLCGGWCGGTIAIDDVENEEDAYEKAMDTVVNRLLAAFPTLDIEYNVECENPDDEEDDEDDAQNEQQLDVCPSCGAGIEPKDGEDNGHGELHLYWTCQKCGATGTAIIDQQDGNAFIEHQLD